MTPVDSTTKSAEDIIAEAKAAAEAVGTDETAIEAAMAPTIDGAAEGIDGMPVGNWSEGALIICDGRAPKKSESRPVIVVQAVDEKGVPLKDVTYPDGAAIYVKHGDADGGFGGGDTRTVWALGDNLVQGRIGEFENRFGVVGVAPAHMAFAAANLAYQAGANKIQIVGLTDLEKDRLKPWFDQLLRRRGDDTRGPLFTKLRSGLQIDLA